jgi:cytochrome c oxidase cbb3-type subunit 4
MNYHIARELADSWGLLVMVMVFLVLTGWAFRKGSRDANDRAANMIFDEDQHNG